MSALNSLTLVRTSADFQAQRIALAQRLFQEKPIDRGEVHAQSTRGNKTMDVLEINHVVASYEVSIAEQHWAKVVQPNLPWAEDHFRERVSGTPVNPPPSHEYWPFNRQANKEHTDSEGRFSHTYPERFWPKHAGGNFVDHQGIRFAYGDLQDLLLILEKNPFTRQAYLPVWFPEDLDAARQGERVPCTLGYHFLQVRPGMLDCTYFMRSCDFLRFWQDDIYMAGRLLQWVAMNFSNLEVGTLHVHLANLHAFVGDRLTLDHIVKMGKHDEDEEWGAGV